MSSSTMASAPKRATGSTGAAGSSSLRDRLAAVLPQGHKFGVHHISTPQHEQSRSAQLHPVDDQIRLAGSKRASPGADQAKEPESKKRTLVFALEVFIFTTAYQTTLFVSKADSTGYLHLLDLPEGAPSPIRQVCATFLAYLLDHRRRNHIQSVVNLFARAQAQYLFPGSVKNKGKHVLDDRGLVRWWCKVLNPLMEGLSKEPWAGTRGYLLVPGLEDVEMRAFIPRTVASLGNWVIGHPLEQISHYTRELNGVPPRCLIPGYPDDPKSRFRDELDEEVSKQKQDIGAWRSVKTLDQFWEMMAFRQECSSGRLTGFIWLVFDPIQSPLPSCFKTVTPTNPLTTSTITCDPSISQGMPPTPSRKCVEVPSHISHLSPPKAPASPTTLGSQPSKIRKKKNKKKLSGLVVPRTPKIKTEARSYLIDRPTATAYYYWPPEARGDKLVQETEYKRIVELLLHLDFSTLDKAVGSSRRWLNEVAIGGSAEGGDVVGRASVAASARANEAAPGTVNGTVTNLTGLIRRKNAPSSTESGAGRTLPPAVKKPAELATEAAPKVNVLGASIVRKKEKKVEGQ